MIRVFSSDTFGIHEYFSISFKVTLTLGLHQLGPSHHATMPSPGITGKLQVRCPEEGCPPVETVITDLSVKAPKPGAGRSLMFHLGWSPSHLLHICQCHDTCRVILGTLTNQIQELPGILAII